MGFKVIRKTDGGVVCQYHGRVSPEDNAKAWAEISDGNPENFSTIKYLISDHTQSEEITHTAQDMENLATALEDQVWKHNPDLLLALVLPRDLVFGLGRLLYAHTKRQDNIRLFRNREEAVAWIRNSKKEK